MPRDPLAGVAASLRRHLAEAGVAVDPRAMKPVELVRILNSTPAGQVLDERRLYRHRSAAGTRIGDAKSIDLFRYAAWLFDAVQPAPRPAGTDPHAVLDAADAYAAHKERARARAAEQAAAGCDIGPMPPIADVARREACRFDLALFARTYNPRAFFLGWSKYHLSMLKRIQQSVIYGGYFAFALPRGFGKTATCRVATQWAIAYRHTHYAFLIGANEGKAVENLSAIKKFLLLDTFAADFPEIALAFEAIGGTPNRAGGQTCLGRRTAVAFEKTRIVLPTVPPPPNWPADWPLNAEGMVPTSGSMIAVSGLTGDGIRGSLHTTEAGELVRPGFVLLDDPQTDESARSVPQCNARENLINGAVLGMEGPGETLTAIMPCTIIQPDDLASRILDRKRNPLWRGETSGILESMPSHMEAWDKYAEIYYECNALDPPDFKKANNYYKRHRKELDAGAKAAWPERKDDCVSAIQLAMHKLLKHGLEAFMAEYMNAPLQDSAEDIRILEPGDVAGRFNGRARGEVPEGAAYLTGFIDIHDDVLYASLAAIDQSFDAAIIWYGTWPEQPIPYFQKRHARKTLARSYPGSSVEDYVARGVSELLARLFRAGAWQTSDRQPVELELLLIDEGYEKTRKSLTAAVRRSGHAARVIFSKGVGISAKRQPLSVGYDTPKKRRSKRISKHGGPDQWYVQQIDGLRHVKFDSNHWKTFLHGRLSQPTGTPGALELFGTSPQVHQLYAEHLTAEKPTQTKGQGRELYEWSLRPGRDNHWLDTTVGCLLGAAILGASLTGERAEPRVRPSAHGTTSPAELRARKRGKGRRR